MHEEAMPLRDQVRAHRGVVHRRAGDLAAAETKPPRRKVPAVGRAPQPPGLAPRRRQFPATPCSGDTRSLFGATRFPCSRRQGTRAQALQNAVAFAPARPRMGPFPARFPDKLPDRRELGRDGAPVATDGPPAWRLMWRGAVPFVYKPRHIADETRAGPADPVSSRSIA
jgi:hypothetical protein